MAGYAALLPPYTNAGDPRRANLNSGILPKGSSGLVEQVRGGFDAVVPVGREEPEAYPAVQLTALNEMAGYAALLPAYAMRVTLAAQT